MPRLVAAERDAFLAEPGHLVRIATVDDDGLPLLVPAWFIHRYDALLVTPRERSAWLAHLRRDPRTCFAVDEEALPYRKVVARGSVTIVHAPAAHPSRESRGGDSEFFSQVKVPVQGEVSSRKPLRFP